MAEPANLSLDLRKAAAAQPLKTALLYEGERVSYADLDKQADRVAGGLRKLGIRPGDRVAFIAGSRPAFAALHFGSLRAGAASTPISVRFDASALRDYLRRVGPRAIIAHETSASVVMASGPHSAPTFVVGAHPVMRSLEDVMVDGPSPDEEVASEDVAVVAHTSGTSGKPKAVALTHGNIAANIDQLIQVPAAGLSDQDVICGVLPPSTTFAIAVVLGLSVRNQMTVLTPADRDPVVTARAIAKSGATVIAATPPTYEKWAALPVDQAYDFSKVRLAVSGGSGMPNDVWEAFKSRFGIEIWEGYGLTEATAVITTTMLGERRLGSAGLPLPGVDLRIASMSGEEALVGDPGELWVGGPTVASGYVGDEGATLAAFANGWLRTGDVGYKDEDGYLWLVDRDEEVIVVSGFNVFPREVERVLQQHESVSDAAVVGEEDSKQGHRVRAFVVLAQGAQAGEHELIVHCTKNLARFKVPGSIEFVDELPRLESGTLLKRALEQSPNQGT